MVIKKSKSEIDADKLIQELANNSEKMTISAKLRLISRINKKLKKATTQPVDIDYSVLVWFSIFETRQFDYSDWRVFPFLNFPFLHSIHCIHFLYFVCFFLENRVCVFPVFSLEIIVWVMWLGSPKNSDLNLFKKRQKSIKISEIFANFLIVTIGIFEYFNKSIGKFQSCRLY